MKFSRNNITVVIAAGLLAGACHGPVEYPAVAVPVACIPPDDPDNILLQACMLGEDDHIEGTVCKESRLLSTTLRWLQQGCECLPANEAGFDACEPGTRCQQLVHGFACVPVNCTRTAECIMARPSPGTGREWACLDGDCVLLDGCN